MKRLILTKRLTTLAIAFTMIFAVGTAFAFGAGMLQIDGTVNIVPPDELYISWHSVDIGGGPVLADAGPRFGAIGAEQEVEFADARGRENQVIVWSMTFDRESFEEMDFALAAITAVARNNSLRPASIEGATLEWSDPVMATALGLSATVNQAAFVGAILPGAHTAPLMVEVEWNGQFPLDFDVDYDSGNIQVSLVLNFNYAPVAP